MKNNNKVQNYFFLTLLIITLALASWLLRPNLGIIVLAGTLAIVFYPLYNRLLKITKQPSLSAFIGLLVVAAVVFIPLTLFGYQIFKEALSLYHQIIDNHDNIIASIQRVFQSLLPNTSLDLDSFIKEALNKLLGQLGPIFSSLSQAAIYLTLGLLSLFYFFRDGQKLKEALINLSPLKNRYDNDIFEHLKVAINSVVKGSLLSSLLHGILIGIGLKVFGLANAALWGVAIFFFSLIPGVGLSLILIPVFLFQFFTGSDLAAFGILVWGIAVNMCLDYLVTPQILKKGMDIHPLLVLFSVLGGLAVLGPIGLLMGPIILSLLLTLLKIYPEIIKG